MAAAFGLVGQSSRALGAPDKAELCLHGGTVLDPRRRLATRADVITRAGIIAEVGLAMPCKGTILDVRGAFIIPGLVDLHVHGWGNPSPTANGEDDRGRESVLRLFLRAGVMAVLDLAGNDGRLALRDRLRGSPQHARLFVASVVVPRTDDEAELRARVRAVATKKPDFIKIISATGPVAPVVDEAQRLGLRAVVHIAAWREAEAALAARAAAITHFEDEALIPDRVVSIWAASPTISIPTMAVQCDLARLHSEPARLSDPLLEALTPPTLRAAYRAHDEYTRRARHWVRWQAEGCLAHDVPTLQRLHGAGVKLLAGSDTGNLGTFQGVSLHSELGWFEAAGVPAWEALAAGTTAAADFLGIPWGVERGAPANLVVLEQSPLSAIAHTRRIVHVVHQGQLVPGAGVVRAIPPRKTVGRARRNLQPTR